MWMLDCMSLHLAKSYRPILLCLESQIYLVPLCPLMLDVLYFSRAHLHVVNFSTGLKQTHSLIWYLYLRIKRACRQPMEWQQLQTSAQHEVWSLIETLEAARRRLDVDQTELRSISPRTTVAVQTYYRVTLQRMDACIDILKNLHTELWRMNNPPLELLHQCTTWDGGQQCNTGDPGTLHPTNWIEASRFWPSVGRNRMPSRWH